MPTEKKQTKKKTTKEESGKEEIKKEGLKVVQPTKFILHIAKCGTDTLSSQYKQIEHDNPVILGLKGVNVMCDGFAPKESHPFYQYLLACAILKGLEFDRAKIFDDIDKIADRIKSLSLKDLKGGTENGEHD
jgi:hypothetical protein